MGVIVSFDESFLTPNSEVVLSSGEHVILSLDRKGLEIKVLASPQGKERVLVHLTPDSVAKICTGLWDNRDSSGKSPLRTLVSIAKRIPNAEKLKAAFKAAAAE
tara:strand:+ start:553 stop:864 length:312 start_codon:yes stop_codon:yes gene_type:complete